MFTIITNYKKIFLACIRNEFSESVPFNGLNSPLGDAEPFNNLMDKKNNNGEKEGKKVGEKEVKDVENDGTNMDDLVKKILSDERIDGEDKEYLQDLTEKLGSDKNELFKNTKERIKSVMSSVIDEVLSNGYSIKNQDDLDSLNKILKISGITLLGNSDLIGKSIVKEKDSDDINIYKSFGFDGKFKKGDDGTYKFVDETHFDINYEFNDNTFNLNQRVQAVESAEKDDRQDIQKSEGELKAKIDKVFLEIKEIIRNKKIASNNILDKILLEKDLATQLNSLYKYKEVISQPQPKPQPKPKPKLKPQPKPQSKETVALSLEELQSLYGKKFTKNDNIETAESDRLDRVRKLKSKFDNSESYNGNTEIEKLYNETIKVVRRTTIAEMNKFENAMKKADSINKNINSKKDIVSKNQNTVDKFVSKVNFPETSTESTSDTESIVATYEDFRGTKNDITVEEISVTNEAGEEETKYKVELEDSTGLFHNDIEGVFNHSPTEDDIQTVVDKFNEAENSKKEVQVMAGKLKLKPSEVQELEALGIDYEEIVADKEYQLDRKGLFSNDFKISVSKEGKFTVKDTDGRIDLKVSDKLTLTETLVKINKLLPLISKIESRLTGSEDFPAEVLTLKEGVTFGLNKLVTPKGNKKVTLELNESGEFKLNENDLVDLDGTIKKLEYVLNSESENEENESLAKLNLTKESLDKIAEKMGATYEGLDEWEGGGPLTKFEIDRGMGFSNDLYFGIDKGEIKLVDDNIKNINITGLANNNLEEALINTNTFLNKLEEIEGYKINLNNNENLIKDRVTEQEKNLVTYMESLKETLPITTLETLNGIIKIFHDLETLENTNDEIVESEPLTEKTEEIEEIGIINFKNALESIKEKDLKDIYVKYNENGKIINSTKDEKDSFTLSFELDGDELVLDTKFGEPATDKSIKIKDFYSNGVINLEQIKYNLIKEYIEEAEEGYNRFIKRQNNK